MTVLRRRHIESTERFWTALEADHAGAPEALQELARGATSVTCAVSEANDALDWASRHPEWVEAPAPVYIAGN